MNTKIFKKVFKKSDEVNFAYQVFFSAIEQILYDKNVCTKQELSDAIDAQIADLTQKQPPDLPLTPIKPRLASIIMPLPKKVLTSE